jgi:phosphomevalonate kinase
MEKKKTTLVWLLGESKVGKDTVGDMFIKKGFTRIAFADKPREELAAKLGIELKDLIMQGPIKEKYRPALIKLAEEARVKDPYVWIKKAFENYQTLEGEFKDDIKLIITDCRRVSEIKWYYKFWKKNRDEFGPFFAPSSEQVNLRLFHVVRQGTQDSDVLTHECIGYTKAINDLNPGFIDATLFNDTTIKDLEAKIEKLIKLYSL